METSSNSYIIYKRTFLATLIAALLLVTGAYSYVTLVDNKNVKNSGAVQTISHGDHGSAKEKEALAENTYSDIADADFANSEGIGLFLNGTASDSEYLWIPVAEGVSSSDITIENHYTDRELWVTINGGDEAYYRDAYISGNLTGVVNGFAVTDDEHLILKFVLDKVYEYNTIFENGVLYVEKVSPRELYDRIVVIDPAGFVPEELLIEDSLTPASICADIASKVMTLLEKDGVRIYMTSLDDDGSSAEEALSLSADVKPDMLVRIETAYDVDSKIYGTETVYNGTYFIPGFGSVELADLIEANVTTSIGGRASGLVAAGQEDIVISKATVPAAAVRVGYYTNTQENILLNRDDYRSKIAEGLYAACMSVYGEEE